MNALKKLEPRKKTPAPSGGKGKGGGNYFTQPSPAIDFIPSGSALLDCVLGGGWPLGRIVNIVGDKSTGKTLLAIEAAANFVSRYNGSVWYREAEAAFDQGYAAALGMPVHAIDFGNKNNPFFTVEDLFEDLEEIVSKKGQKEGLYIIDSLDALSDRAELGREIGEGSFGAQKAKKMGELFRRLVQKLEQTKVCVMFISQVRDNIGVSFGEKYIRSGGHALDFYASQCVWLHHKGVLERTVKKQKRAYGIKIMAKCKKNKISLPLRVCEFPIVFGFGVDDLHANLEFLAKNDMLDELDDLGLNFDYDPKSVPTTMKAVDKLSDKDYDYTCIEVGKLIREIWYDIEQHFLPVRQKYRG